MKLQEALNRAVLGIVKQGRLSVDSYNDCLYRVGENGPRCAIGQLLNDNQLAEIEKSDLNSADVVTLVDRGILDKSFRHPFFEQLQAAHDGAADLDDFLAKAKVLADRYNLTFPEL